MSAKAALLAQLLERVEGVRGGREERVEELKVLVLWLFDLGRERGWEVCVERRKEAGVGLPSYGSEAVI